MAALRRIPVSWSGITALPGVSIFYAPFGTDAGADLMTFFNAIKGVFPTGLTWQVPTSGDTIQDLDGAVTGAWTSGTGGTVVATGAGAFASGCGGYVNWQTGTIVGRHRLKGRTFMAPLIGSSYDSSGTVLNTTLTTIGGAAATLASSGHLVIWHRPSEIAAADGTNGAVTGSLMPDQVTSLKTRRR